MIKFNVKTKSPAVRHLLAQTIICERNMKRSTNTVMMQRCLKNRYTFLLNQLSKTRD